LRVVGVRSVREQEGHEVLGKRVSNRSGERVRVIHRLLILDADRDDLAGGHCLEVHLVMGPHHAEGLPDVLRDMPPEGAQAARQ
jgi:hypothetical protein